MRCGRAGDRPDQQGEIDKGDRAEQDDRQRHQRTIVEHDAFRADPFDQGAETVPRRRHRLIASLGADVHAGPAPILPCPAIGKVRRVVPMRVIGVPRHARPAASVFPGMIHDLQADLHAAIRPFAHPSRIGILLDGDRLAVHQQEPAADRLELKPVDFLPVYIYVFYDI